MPNVHDQLVSMAATALRPLGTVRCDLGGGDPYTLPTVSPLVLSALVPTRATFGNFAAMSPSDLHWRVPDLALERGGRRVLIDVCGWRESNARAARKIENIVAASRKAHIVGAVLLHEAPARQGYTRSTARDKELTQAMDQLHRTVELLLRRQAMARESAVGGLRAVWEAAPEEAVGLVRWECVEELVAEGPSWTTALVAAAERLLGFDEPLQTRSGLVVG